MSNCCRFQPNGAVVNVNDPVQLLFRLPDGRLIQIPANPVNAVSVLDRFLDLSGRGHHPKRYQCGLWRITFLFF